MSLGQWSVCSATVIGYLLGDDVGELGQRDRTGDHLLDAEAGREFRAAGGELDDAVTARVGETLDRGVDRLRADAVDGRERERVLLGAAQHLGVDLGRGDGHGEFLSAVLRLSRQYLKNA